MKTANCTKKQTHTTEVTYEPFGTRAWCPDSLTKDFKTNNYYRTGAKQLQKQINYQYNQKKYGAEITCKRC